MALNTKLRVPLPEKGIIVRKSGVYRYVYKVLSTYRTENGQPTNKRRSIGKIDTANGMLIPNDTYWELCGDPDIMEQIPSYNSVRSIGATFLIGRLLENLGVSKILKEVYGNNKASIILTASEYMVCRGNVFERVLDWCEGFTLNESPLSSISATYLFSSITHEEKMSFFKAWAALQPHQEYLAYDVTSFSTYAVEINDAEWGYNRDEEKLPQINFGCYLDQKNGLPVFYVTYPGSIVDKSHLQYMMAYNRDLGIGDDVCFIIDRGFCTTTNVKYMHSTNKSYILGVEIGHKATLAAIDKIRDNITSMRYRIKADVYARSVHSRFYGVPSTMHIYYDPIMAEHQRHDLLQTIDEEDNKLLKLEQLTNKEAKRYRNHFDIQLAENGTFKYDRNYNKIDDAAKNCGYFSLLTNTNTGSNDALTTYRKKDTIEKSFDDLKNHIDMKRLRTHSSTTTDGKMFCAFIALIAVSEMTNRLSCIMKKKSMSKDGLISELEKIKIIIMPDGKRLINPITKTQRTIFEACGLTTEDLRSYVDTD